VGSVAAAELLQNARHSADLTQAEVAQRAGTSQPAVARYEQGAALPTLPTLRRMRRRGDAEDSEYD
jgi:transcriptional regulator with XRE-family HTH domain